MSYTQNLQNLSIAEDKWVTNLINRINALEGDACKELNQIKQDGFDYLQKKLNQLTSGTGQSQLIKILLEVPTDIDSAIKWIESAIELVIKPYETAYLATLAQIAQVPIELARLMSAVASAAGKLESCVTELPNLTQPPAPTPTAPPS